MQRVITGMKVASALGIVGAVVLGVIKETHGRDLIVLNPKFVIGQVICYAVLLLVLTVVFAAWTWRVVDSRRRGMVWTLRRRKAKRVRRLHKLPYDSDKVLQSLHGSLQVGQPPSSMPGTDSVFKPVWLHADGAATRNSNLHHCGRAAVPQCAPCGGPRKFLYQLCATADCQRIRLDVLEYAPVHAGN